MQTNNERPVGVIKVSPEVIIRIAEAAASEIDGVESQNQRLAVSKINNRIFGAVRVKVNADSAAIQINMIVKEGHNAVNVAEQVQNSVKSAVQNMSGLTVSKVDVRVVGIKFND